MTTESQLPEITFTDDFGDHHQVYVLQGDRRKGIGYEAGAAVIMSGGNVQPGAKMSEKWQWGDGSGRYWSVDGKGIWQELNHGCSPESGWKLY